jgi:hypothetical protein
LVTFAPHPIPVVTEMGDGYVLYVKENGMLENDEFAVVLSSTGVVRHFTSTQIKIWRNATYNINL